MLLFDDHTLDKEPKWRWSPIEKNWLVWQCTMVLMYAPVLFSGTKIKMREPDRRNIELIREEHVYNEFIDWFLDQQLLMAFSSPESPVAPRRVFINRVENPSEEHEELNKMAHGVAESRR